MNYYERHIGDYLKDTAHLSLLEHGVYARLLDVYYTREQPFAPGEAARLVGARTKEERAAVESVLAEFFVDGRQARCDREIERYQARVEHNQRVGKLGGRPKKTQTQTEPDDNPPGSFLEPEPNPPSLQSPDTREIPSTLSGAPAFPLEKPPALTLVGDPDPKAKALPDCPHQAVLALWAEVLPALPQHNASLWKGTRAAHLRARWRETAAEKGWASEVDGLEYLRRLFRYVGQSRFLTGRTPAAAGRPPFVAELAWLVSPENWAKTIEGKYHSEAA